MDADGLAGRGEIADGPEGVRYDQHTPLRLPEGDLLPDAVPDDADELTALAMSVSSIRRCGTPSRVATAAESRSCRSRSWTTASGSPRARIRSSIPGMSTGSKTSTAPPNLERMRGPLEETGLGPAEAALELVAELEAQPPRNVS